MNCLEHSTCISLAQISKPRPLKYYQESSCYFNVTFLSCQFSNCYYMCNDSTKAPKSARKKMVLCCCGQNKDLGHLKKHLQLKSIKESKSWQLHIYFWIWNISWFKIFNFVAKNTIQYKNYFLNLFYSLWLTFTLKTIKKIIWYIYLFALILFYRILRNFEVTICVDSYFVVP